jgi:hypothetical protein
MFVIPAIPFVLLKPQTSVDYFNIFFFLFQYLFFLINAFVFRSAAALRSLGEPVYTEHTEKAV